MDPTAEEMQSFRNEGKIQPIVDWAGIDPDDVETNISWQSVFFKTLGAKGGMHWRIIGAMPQDVYQNAIANIRIGNTPALPIVATQYALVGRVCRMLAGVQVSVAEEKEKQEL